MTREERENALHCLKVMIDEEMCEECKLYGTTGTDHCEEDCVRVAIEALEQEPNTWSLDDAREDFMYDVYNTLDFLPTNEEANQIIDSFDRVTSSIKQEPRWIPVTERLPEEKGLYLVSVKNDHNRRYSKTCWFHGGDNWFARQDVLAWMPLPEPYKAESEPQESEVKE